VSDRTKLTP
jgi:UDP-N-acetylglucosamine/UDP-N-acetylgalactosamine diphosphorylase